MHHLNSIIYPHLLIENNHLNLINVQFDNESLVKFVKQFNNNFINSMVTEIRISQEITNEQKNILINCFPNLKHFIFASTA
jgi:hypothetical protein